MNDQNKSADARRARPKIVMERIYKTSIGKLWEHWTTKQGIESWWGPEGFTTEVLELDLRAGGHLLYAMTATAPAQVQFMKNAGMPLTNKNRITYTQVVPESLLTYTHLADFIPGFKPYDVATQVEFHPLDGENVRMVLTLDPMHDEQWTRRAVMGHESQLGKLQVILSGK